MTRKPNKKHMHLGLDNCLSVKRAIWACLVLCWLLQSIISGAWSSYIYIIDLSSFGPRLWLFPHASAFSLSGRLLLELLFMFWLIHGVLISLSCSGLLFWIRMWTFELLPWSPYLKIDPGIYARLRTRFSIHLVQYIYHIPVSMSALADRLTWGLSRFSKLSFAAISHVHPKFYHPSLSSPLQSDLPSAATWIWKLKSPIQVNFFLLEAGLV